MDYKFKQIEKYWQKYWAEYKSFKAENQSDKPKYYVLDMFPYPSGAGLHVGHPLGYIASDILARYKRLKGYNVLHPMGYDSFGLPAEQYAIQTGQHPAVTTEVNIKRYRQQLDNMGFSFDWDREVRTSDPAFYRWTQWIFMQLFNSWYDKEKDKAQSVGLLIQKFEESGTTEVAAVCDEACISFSADEWKAMSQGVQQKELLKYRLAYLAESTVNWCPALGTVLANDEVKDGFSERGGYPVIQKKMMQWSMRISAYAERLLQGLDTIDWTDAIKEMQRNWIGKSEGASLKFKIQNSDLYIEIFTTRPDTVFGVSFVTLAPEHELVDQITTAEFKAQVDEYKKEASLRSERERMADVKKVSGRFTGAYVEHPFTGKAIPVWIGDYVLSGYGTGAVMAVPAHDTRDYTFAKHFQLPILEVVSGGDVAVEAYDAKEGVLINSGFLNGLQVKGAMRKAIEEIEAQNLGKGKINYRLRDAVFGRQRYWGEPVPVYFKNDLPYLIEEKDLPLLLPEVDKYLPTEDGEPPLARSKDWKYKDEFDYEWSTMPGWAGSSWYWYRYMDAQNDKAFVSKEAMQYWKDVDLYIGGSEHATGHLLYARFWNKFLKDMGYVNAEEPFKKLINQGMIQGRSNFVYRVAGENTFVSKNLIKDYTVSMIHVDVNIVDQDILNIEAFKNWREEYKDAKFMLEAGKYICGNEVEKMSKSKFNVVNPDDLIERYGADTLRMYEMFLGPLEQSKPWNTNGIEGVFKFLRKFWKLFHNDQFNFSISDEEPGKAEYKALHKIIKKVEEDIDRFSFNTSVSAFMICVNELTDLKCNKRKILQDLVIVLSPYAPHICEELWKLLGNQEGTLSYVSYPEFNEQYLQEDEFSYPVSINGKTRLTLPFPLTMETQEIEKRVLANEKVQSYLEGKIPKKVIIVKGRIVNVVV